MLNQFSDDATTISINYLLDLLYQRAWTIRLLFKVCRYNSDAHHYVAVLESGHVICDCMMITNLGIPCRHIYTVLFHAKVMFHLAMFNAR